MFKLFFILTYYVLLCAIIELLVFHKIPAAIHLHLIVFDFSTHVQRS